MASAPVSLAEAGGRLDPPHAHWLLLSFLIAIISVTVMAAQPRTEAQEERGFRKEGEGTGKGLPAGLQKCSQSLGSWRRRASARSSWEAEESTGTHGSVLGQRSPFSPSVKVRGDLAMDSERGRRPWEIVAIPISCLPLPSTGKCPFPGSCWAASCAKKGPGSQI